MTERDAEATRRRLLTAARTEFARYGIAGARVDRIAAAARSNKAQIYHYFGSKEGLFDAVFAGLVEASIENEYFDARDLPETAARLFDDFELHGEVGRLVLWYRLERSGRDASIATLEEANLAKVDAIRAAQAEGLVTDEIPAPALLGLVITIATAWNSLPPEFGVIERELSVGQRREAVIRAVRRLVTR